MSFQVREQPSAKQQQTLCVHYKRCCCSRAYGLKVIHWTQPNWKEIKREIPQSPGRWSSPAFQMMWQLLSLETGVRGQRYDFKKRGGEFIHRNARHFRVCQTAHLPEGMQANDKPELTPGGLIYWQFRCNASPLRHVIVTTSTL